MLHGPEFTAAPPFQASGPLIETVKAVLAAMGAAVEVRKRISVSSEAGFPLYALKSYVPPTTSSPYVVCSALDPFKPSPLAVIVTFPKRFVVTLPLESTSAMLGALEVQAKFLATLAPLASLKLAVKVTASPIFNRFELGPVTVTLGVPVPPPPQAASVRLRTRSATSFFMMFLSGANSRSSTRQQFVRWHNAKIVRIVLHHIAGKRGINL